MSTAGAFHREFFGVVAKDKDGDKERAAVKRKICAVCRAESDSRLEEVTERIRLGQPALRGLEAFLVRE